MTVVNPPTFLQNAGATHTAEITRNLANILVGGALSSGSLKSRGGVHPDLGGGLAVTQNGTPNMTVNVAAGLVAVPGTEGSKQGVYVCLNDATVNLSVPAADPTNPRIDLVVAKVQDSFYSGGTNTWSLAVVAGTPAGSPTPPAAPANSITLANLAVSANDTSIVTGDITDKRILLSGVSGVIRCTSTTRPAVGTVSEGQVIYQTDTDSILFTTDTGTTWVQNTDYINGSQGYLGGKRYTGSTDRASVTGTEALANMDTGSVALPANRIVKIAVKLKFVGTVTQASCVFRIRDGSLVGTEVGSLTFVNVNNAFTYIVEFDTEFVTTSAVSKTFVLTAVNISGGGTMTIQTNGASSAMYMRVEDLGPSSRATTVP